MALESDFDAVEYLVSQKFELMRPGRARIGRLRDAESIAEKKEQAEAWAEYVNRANDYRLELEAKPEGELEALVNEVRLARAERYRQEHLERERTHWANQPGALASKDCYGYWSKAAYWTNMEALALLIGRDPIIFTRNRLEESNTYFEARGTFHALERLVERATEMGVLQEKNEPKKFVEWAQGNRIFVPESLLDALSDHHKCPSDLENKYNVQTIEIRKLKTEVEALRLQASEQEKFENGDLPISTRERESLLKIVIGVAIKKYNYSPAAAKNSATLNIATALRELNIALDEDTIRKYLNEARDLFSGEIVQ